jgi:hypothetical protein
MPALEVRIAAGCMNHPFHSMRWFVVEANIPGGPPVGCAAPVAVRRWPWLVLATMCGAALIAYLWSVACPPTPFASILMDQTWVMGFLLILALTGILANWRKPLRALRFPSLMLPLYLLGLVPKVASTIDGWEGGWLLGSAGAAAGAAAGALTGWLLIRWDLQEPELQRSRIIMSGRISIPGAFAVLFAVFGNVLGAYLWATTWQGTPNEGWGIGIFVIAFALLGALVRRPFTGLLVALPLVLVLLVPFVASTNVGWEGGWVQGIAGAAAGTAGGAGSGWLFARCWLLPEFKKRRERELRNRLPRHS